MLTQNSVLSLTVGLAIVLGANAWGQAGERVLSVAGHQVTNIGPWQPDSRLDDRPEDLWRYYMHGIVDHFATPIAWEQIAGEQQDLSAWLVDDPIDTPYKRSDMPALRIAGDNSLEFDRPLPIPMDDVRGKRVRLFVWLRGEDVGARNNCWHAPSLYVIFRDADGAVLSGSDSYFKTLRTYPWHCYYTDRFVPEDAAGIHVRPFNKFHGAAYFSTLSWESVGEHNTYELNDRQDPVTGSTAPNALYDEMPDHLKRGFASRYRWRFVLGEDAGLIGQPYNITTHEGFRRYYFEKAKKEPEHMNHAILHMGSMYRSGTENGHLPPMEAGWLENFAEVLRDDQDPETGYWHDGFEKSLGLTFHLCNMHFRYWELPRADRADRRSGHNLGVDGIPRADRIVRTTLDLQSTYEAEDGTRRLAAWNWPAYRWVPDPDEYEQKCYLGTTWDAIWLLRAASRYVDAAAQAEIYESVKGGLRYVFEACVLPDGTWKQHDTDDAPSKGDYMWGIMQDSAWLERKINEEVPAPDITVSEGEGALRFEWRDPVGEQNSVRIYAAEAATLHDGINESHLVGIIQRTGHVVQEMDPLVGVQFIRSAGQRRFGWDEDLPPADHWRGRRYLPWKLRMLDSALVHTVDLKPLTMAIPDGHAVYVSAVTWYGEESAPRQIDLP
ncbi:MAG: hypothetical protein GF393_09325 [Armatimonadia bacterium]|nr:hypothetical protein [Armatimonadia bacterium]